MKRGFTLVELSIVLVIVGLLIAGVLVARSMISSATVMNEIKQLQNYSIAVNNFKNNYKGFEPGDDLFFVPNGNGDGMRTGISCKGIYDGDEGVQFWAHLSQAGMIKGNYLPDSPLRCGGSMDNIHENNAGITSPVFTSNTLYKTIYGASSAKVYPQYGYGNGAGSSYFYVIPYTIDAVAIDSKVDDGNGSTGFVRDLIYPTAQTCDAYIRTASDGNSKLCQVFWYSDAYMGLYTK